MHNKEIEQPCNEPSEPSATAKLIRKIGVGYALDFMPAPLLVGFNQLRRKLERAGFKVQVALVPLNELPPDLDVLFVPTEIEQIARKAAPDKWIIALDSYLNHPAYSELVKRLQDGQEIYALPAEEEQTESGGVIVRYRGYERIE